MMEARLVGNPYIEALPPLCTLSERMGKLSVLPHVDPAERTLRHVDRRYALMRLFHFFSPAARHLRFAEGVDMLIRAGYEGRNPAGYGHERRVQAIARRSRSGQLLAPSTQAVGPSFTAALIGAPGMGKSRTIGLALDRYEQVIRHPGMPAQIAWLKLECPKRGSLRSICTQFFTQISGLVGNTDYLDLYVNGGSSEGDLQNMMAVAASFHGLGLLAIDEIQHMGRSLEGEHELMTFLTSLSNQLGIPVLFIGTLSVLSRVQETCRMARRSVGPGSAVWHPLNRQDDEWNTLLDQLWRYQWTSTFTEPSQELRNAFFDCTGGILDLMVKLFLSVQLRLIYRSEIRGTDDEVITPDFVRGIADVDFRPVKHIVDALVGGDDKKIRRFDDLHSFDDGFRQAMAELVERQLGVRLITSAQTAASTADIEIPLGDHYQVIWSRLRATGLGDDVILRLIDAARAAGHDAEKDLLGFYEQVLKLKTKIKQQKKENWTLELAALDESDLRRLVPEAAARGLTPVEALRQKGLSGIWPTRRAA